MERLELVSRKDVLDIIAPRFRSARIGSLEHQRLYSIMDTVKGLPSTEAGLIAACHCKDCAHKEVVGKETGRVYCPKTNSWRDADDFCKYAKKGLES